MCGIAGMIYHVKTDCSRIVADCMRLSAQLKHRGPDDEGFVLVDSEFNFHAFRGNDSADLAHLPHIQEARGDFQLALVHRRLSIVGLGVQGHQPMAHGNLVLAYNGETFNYRELNAKYDFQNTSNTDTETVLNLFETAGNEAVQELEGFFAGIIINKETKSYTVFRDKTGVKPLYVHSNAEFTCYCSETKAIKAVAKSITPSASSFLHYFAEGIIDTGLGTSMYQEISEFPKGKLLEIPLAFNGKRTTLSVHSIDKVPDSAKLRQQLINSVSKRLMSDVPLGFAVSGGLDSAIIIGIARKLMPDAELKAFSVVSDHPESDESEWQKQVVAYNHAKWVKINMSDADPDLLVDVVNATDLPPVAWNNLAHFELCRTVKNEGVTVLFNGQGADELFGGYPDYLQRSYFELMRTLSGKGNWPLSLKEMRNGWLKLKVQQHLPDRLLQKIFFKGFSDVIADDLLKGSSLLWSKASLGAEEKMKDDYFGMKLGQMLLWEDRNGMSSSIESRNPFADDPCLASYLNMPFEQKITNGYSKGVLRDAAMGLVPESVLWRVDKKGFTVPDSQLTWKNKARWKDAFFSVKLNDFSPLYKRQRLWNSLSEGNTAGLRKFFRLTAYSHFLNQSNEGQE